MNCARLRQVLDAHVDGELDHATAGDVTMHLVECPACAAIHDQRMVVQRAVRMHAPYHALPATLAPAVLHALVDSEKPTKPRLNGMSWFHVAAFATVAALAGLVVGYRLAQPLSDFPMRDLAVANHVMALAPERPLIEIASSDRHTVKPWFQGRIDFAPPVKDLTGNGFALLGARLDHIGDRPTAAVVYQIRKHVINLFVWRATDHAQDALSTSSVRGFSVATWSSGGLHFAAVSDVESRDLTRFAELVSTP